MTHTKSYISPDIAITERLPENINAYLRELTFLDQNDPDLFLNRVDDLWVLAKNAYAEGQISKRTFDQLDEKYIAYSNQIFLEEWQNEHKNLQSEQQRVQENREAKMESVERDYDLEH